MGSLSRPGLVHKQMIKYCLFVQCLSPVSICDGWSITTVEGLGDKDSGYHPIQKAIAATGNIYSRRIFYSALKKDLSYLANLFIPIGFF